MAVIKASLDVTRPSLPQSAAMVSSAFRIFSVAASSVLKNSIHCSVKINPWHRRQLTKSEISENSYFETGNTINNEEQV